MDRGQDYGKIKKSIVISFVKGRLFSLEVPMHSVYTLHERSIYRELSDILEQLCAYIKSTGNPEEKAYVDELVKKGRELIGMTDKVLKKVSEDEKLRDLWLVRGRDC
ncbi:MAG: hypothetical protein Q4C46_06790 [Bacillota bacterium]|nr:hypothetical protein [Bacillota bacterium]